MMGGALPLAPPSARALVLTATVVTLAYAAALAAGLGAHPVIGLWTPFAVILSAAVASVWRAVTVADGRAAWALFAVANVTWVAAELIYNLHLADLDPVPIPSAADWLYLAFYPLAVAALAAALRGRAWRRAFWMDAAIGFAGIAALATLLLGLVDLEGLADQRPIEVLVNAAYPVGDLLLITVIAGAMAIGRWPLTRHWTLVALAMLAWVQADTVYLVQVASDSYREGTLWDLGWPLGGLLLTYAAWQPLAAEAPTAARWRPLVIPAVFGVLALVLLVWDHFFRTSDVAIVSAALAVALIIGRLVVTFAENLRLLDLRHEQAHTDTLTGLPNRRALLDDLDAIAERGGPPSLLVLYDLDGFKRYNDTFGHLVGDDLLRRLGERLRGVAASARGRAYRLGGDEFCLLGADEDLARAGAEALREQGEGFAITASWGEARLPCAGGTSGALHEADRAMYARKREGRPPAADQTHDALMAAVGERHPDLRDHVDGVAELAAGVAAEVGMSPAQIALVRRAAELHDIGKIAIPDEILLKRGPLDEQEWRYMHRHTIIGERILEAAADLRDVAPLVRASHERWDGGGYPDGLAGEQIPLGARIVAVCDAFDAMISDRPYRRAMPVAAALAELRRCAGQQFDPGVVEAFHAVVARRRALPLAAA